MADGSFFGVFNFPFEKGDPATALQDAKAYKIPISVTLMLTGVSIVVLLGALTIASQTWRAATVNPVNSLRYE
jgi:hypothetical protein